MTALPSSVSFTDSGITEAQFKTAITNQREYLAGLLGVDGEKSTALDTLGTLGSSTLSKSSAYTVLATDRGAVIECTGTFTLSLTAAATLGNGFIFTVHNIGSGSITIDPNSTELINGLSSIVIASGEILTIRCSGTAFNSLIPVGGGVTLLGTLTTTSGTTQTLSGLTLTSYKQLYISIDRVSHSNAATGSTLRLEALNMTPIILYPDFGYGVISIDLENNGTFTSVCADNATSGIISAGVSTGARAGESGITTSTTSLTFDWSTASTFDSGTIKVYGVK